MISQQSRIKEIFDGLLESQGDPRQRVRTRIDHGSPISLYAACTFPQRHVMLEIGPIKKAYLPYGFTRPRIKGLDISIAAGKIKSTSDVTLLLELQQTDAIDVFTTFVAKVCEEMDSLEKPEDAVRAVIALVDRWQKFFAGSSELLTDGRQTGLYGELYLIKKLFNHDIPLSTLIDAWTGSRRTNQDFEFGNVSIEVKSSAAVDATTVNITNIRQLDATGLDLLMLSHILLDARRGEENTLPDLIDELRIAIANKAPEQGLNFEEKLLQAKYRDEHAEHYATRSYSERSINFYEVKDDFPRLLEHDLPDGITKATYEITLEYCKPFLLSADHVYAKMRTYCD